MSQTIYYQSRLVILSPDSKILYHFFSVFLGPFPRSGVIEFGLGAIVLGANLGCRTRHFPVNTNRDFFALKSRLLLCARQQVYILTCCVGEYL